MKLMFDVTRAKGIFDSELPKHRKKSQKSGLKRSDHKHEYQRGWIRYPFANPITGKAEWRYNRIRYCNICGRIGENEAWPTKGTALQPGDVIFDVERTAAKFVRLDAGYHFQ